jgi:hypothetical protein
MNNKHAKSLYEAHQSIFQQGTGPGWSELSDDQRLRWSQLAESAAAEAPGVPIRASKSNGRELRPVAALVLPAPQPPRKQKAGFKDATGTYWHRWYTDGDLSLWRTNKLVGEGSEDGTVITIQQWQAGVYPEAVGAFVHQVFNMDGRNPQLFWGAPAPLDYYTAADIARSRYCGSECQWATKEIGGFFVAVTGGYGRTREHGAFNTVEEAEAVAKAAAHANWLQRYHHAMRESGDDLTWLAHPPRTDDVRQSALSASKEALP